MVSYDQLILANETRRIQDEVNSISLNRSVSEDESNHKDYEENDSSSNKRKAHDYCKIRIIYITILKVLPYIFI